MLEYLAKRRPVGGLRLDARKLGTTRQGIQASFIPTHLWIPLEARGETGPEPCVTIGARVRRGQTIARGSAATPDVHASTSGRVVGIETQSVVTGGALCEAPCIVIETDGDDEPAPIAPGDRGDRLERVRRSGIVGLGGAAYSTARKIAQTERCRTVVINGAECEPYISCDDLLMRERAADVVAGSIALRDLVAAEECIIAIERDKPQAIAAVKEAARAAADVRLKVAEIPSIYPAGGERQLIDLLTAREVPSGRFPSDLGFLCQNVGTAYAVHRALAHGEPIVARIVTVAGAGVAKPQNTWVLIGTRIEDLIEHCGGYTAHAEHLIVGGSMMGLALPSDAVPVSKSTNCVIAASSEELAVPSTEWPCIRCGECALVCPAYLLPQRLLAAARSSDSEKLVELGLNDCIECGCCDAVCPSHIRLTQAFRDAKVVLHARADQAALSLASQRRYAARTERLEHEHEHEREQQSRLISALGDDADERSRSIEAAVERARKGRDPNARR